MSERRKFILKIKTTELNINNGINLISVPHYKIRAGALAIGAQFNQIALLFASIL